MDEDRLLEQFVVEAEELIESLRGDLDEAERQRKAGRVQPGLLNRIFRSAHSLKGIAGMAGVDPVRLVAHRFEDLLDDLRMGRLAPRGNTFDGGLEVAEGLATLVAAAARGQEAGDDAERLIELVDDLRKGRGGASSRDETAFVELDERARQTLTEYEEHRLGENARERRPIYEASVSFALAEFDSGFRAFAAKLGEVGEVICTLPAPAGDDPMRIGFRIVFASDEPPAALGRLASEAGGSLRLISRYAAVAEGEPDAGDDERGGADALDGIAATVRVDVRSLEALAALAQDLALRVAELGATVSADARRLGAGAREEFDVKQRSRAIERGFAELEERIVDLRLVPLSSAFARGRRLVLATASELGREVAFETEGEEVRLDKAIVDRIAEPLSHLLQNAVSHGIEPREARAAAGKAAAGRVSLRAEPRGSRVCITVADDGPGIDAAAVRRAAAVRGIALASTEERAIEAIFEPGLSTADEVNAVSGRGVGLDVVAAVVRDLGGSVEVESEPGRGAAFHLVLPATLVMISALFVDAGSATYALDVNQIEEIAVFEAGAEAVEWRGERIPLYDLARLVGANVDASRASRATCLVACAGDERFALRVDRIEEQREVIVKSLGRYTPRLRGVSGAVDLEGRKVALLLDLAALVAAEPYRGNEERRA